MKSWTKIALIAIPLAGLFSCLKPAQYPDEPIIEFNRIDVYGDTAYLFINFTDGDGDIGLGDVYTDPPFDTSSIYYNNIFIKYYEKVNGVWVQGTKIPSGEPVEFNYRTLVITPSGQNKALKGEIRVMLSPTYYNPLSADSDTIMYRISMCDRALHMSNEVESNVIIRN